MPTKPISTQVIVTHIAHLIKKSVHSQAEYARRIGIPPSHLNRFLKGHGDIRSSLFVALLQELGFDFVGLLKANLQKEPKKNLKSPLVVQPWDADALVELLRTMPVAERRAATLLIERMAGEKKSRKSRSAK